jgi:hypothetical protein
VQKIYLKLEHTHAKKKKKPHTCHEKGVKSSLISWFNYENIVVEWVERMLREAKTTLLRFS